jgi:RNA polymerase sigma factor (sigma-70 family)
MDDKETLRLIDENIAWANAIAGAYAATIRHVDVKDIKQEAGVALCRAADTYDPCRKVPFRAYAHTCITNRLDSLYRAGQKQAHEQTTLDSPAFFDDVNDETLKDQIPSPDVDSAREAHRNEVRRALAAGMYRLTANQREILEARSRGESYREIADRLGITKQAVEAASSRALAQMRISVEAKGVRGAMFMPSVEGSSSDSRSNSGAGESKGQESTGCTGLLLCILVIVVITGVLIAILR